MDETMKKSVKIERIIRGNTIYIILVVMILAASILSPNFRSFANISNLLSQSSIIGILAVGQTIVLITGGFDLSMSSMIALSSVVTALFLPYGYLLAPACLTHGGTGKRLFCK